MSGALHKERATISYACHGVVTDRRVFHLSLAKIHTPAEISVTNQKHGLNIQLSFH